jgi:hypothetical protein
MIYEKTDIPGIVRDVQTKALINTNLDGLVAYKIKKNQAAELAETKKKVDSLQNEMSEIKQLLQKIVEKI